jgi:hypothetical protein
LPSSAWSFKKPCRCRRAAPPVLARAPPSTKTLLPAATPFFLPRRQTFWFRFRCSRPPSAPQVGHARARKYKPRPGYFYIESVRWPRVHVPRPTQIRVLLSTLKPSAMHLRPCTRRPPHPTADRPQSAQPALHMLSGRVQFIADTGRWVVQPAAASQRRRHVRVQVEEREKCIPRQSEAASQVRWTDIPADDVRL